MSNKPKECGIYKITNLVTKQVYIGSTVSKVSRRINAHKNQLRKNKHVNKHFQNSWNKYGEENFEFEILEYGLDTKVLHERENFYINLYQTRDREKGFNKQMAPGEIWEPPVFDACRGDKIAQKFVPEGYIVTYPNNKEELIGNLCKFARDNNLNPKCLFDCVVGRQGSHKGYKVKYTNPRLQKTWQSTFDNKLQSYVLFSPEGERFEVTNLLQWLTKKGHKDWYAGFVSCASQEGNYSLHGWQCYYTENAPAEYTPTDQLKGLTTYLVIDPERNHHEVTLQLLKSLLEHEEENYENLVRLARLEKYQKTNKGYYCCKIENKDKLLQHIKIEELSAKAATLLQRVDTILDNFFFVPSEAQSKDYLIYNGLRDDKPTVVKPNELKQYCEDVGIKYARALDCAAGRQKSTRGFYVKRVKYFT